MKKLKNGQDWLINLRPSSMIYNLFAFIVEWRCPKKAAMNHAIRTIKESYVKTLKVGQLKNPIMVIMGGIDTSSTNQMKS